jgi:HD-GYP domain-containing protein (c-di-GMP phosphodiesterase class II)
MYVPFPSEALEINVPVPVNIWDPKGVLLLRKGEVVRNAQHREYLLMHSPMVDDEEHRAWSYRYTAEIDRRLRGNEVLTKIAGVTRPMGVENQPSAVELTPTEAWTDLHAILQTLLHQNVEAQDFVSRLVQLEQRMEQVLRTRVDDSLFVLVQLLFDRSLAYSSTHALLCSVICRMVGQTLTLPQGELDSLSRAALTMNIGMARLQDALTRQTAPLSEEQRIAIQRHPAEGVSLLRQLGVGDPSWLELVADHHEDASGTGYPKGKRVQSVACQLLRLTDVFVARISPRQARAGLLPQLAARDVYLSEGGQPSPLGAAFVKTLGLYIPGSYVKLADGEVAVVVRRGRRANAPLVFAIIGRQGMPLGEPAPRDTLDREHEVKGSVAADDVKVRINVPKLLSRV